MKLFPLRFALPLLLTSTFCCADNDWLAITLDNDVMVGDDSGYTNGFVVSVFDAGTEAHQPKPGWMLFPLRWSLDEDAAAKNLNGYAIGQLMVTPTSTKNNVEIDDEVPYSGLLFATNVHLRGNPDYTDLISTTLGVVGPAAGVEQMQTFFHGLFDNDLPKGWQNQLHNELVFQFARSRLWRMWANEHDSVDFLGSTGAKLGTISSDINGALMFRYGRGLASTYALPMLASSRTTNPIAVDKGWFLFAGVNTAYTFNQIFLDGNTFQDSPSAEYDPLQIGGSIGVTYSLRSVSGTFAITDLNFLAGDDYGRNDESLTRYGSVTLAWRI